MKNREVVSQKYAPTILATEVNQTNLSNELSLLRTVNPERPSIDSIALSNLLLPTDTFDFCVYVDRLISKCGIMRVTLLDNSVAKEEAYDLLLRE